MPSSGISRSSRTTGFTLIEVMFVIMIVGTLSAMLFPVLSQSKGAAKKANCISNLRQVSMAVLAYSVDYDDRTCFGIGSGTSMPTGVRYWWGFVTTDNEVDYNGGLIGPYLKSGPVQECPCAVAMPPNGLAHGIGGAGNIPAGFPGYGNAGASPDLSALESPAETILLSDVGGLLPPDLTTVKRWSFSPPLFVSYSVHARHGGEVAVQSWHDGHVKASRLSYRPFDSIYAPGLAVPAAKMKAARLGDLLKYPRTATGATTSGFGAVVGLGDPKQCDWYYYISTKPKC